ncbi:glycosyl hydrolase family protein [Actinidia rufa]|uniref:Glycosyl hydrolase family protein n=1 Tax=Actinidia rufa TaxID=165716 RepID=A0A7J0GRN3_9ERIC|nr:glycosyl hydrolase family protein [Actinidia rufa]
MYLGPGVWPLRLNSVLSSEVNLLVLSVIWFLLEQVEERTNEMEGTSCIYKNPNQPIEARVKDLLSRMTLREKIGQMTQIDRSVARPSALRDLSIGSILSAGGGGPFEKSLSSDWADMIDGFQKSALQSRLGIPLLYGTDAVHGNNNVYGATVFPHNVGLGAARDAELVRRIGVATALEVRACGAQFTFAPCVAVCRDPRWGRCYESYSEDTEIVRKMTPIVTGLQGQPPQGHPRDYPFVAGKGVCTVMASYSSWNGRNLHSDHFLITQVLKEKLGFKGFVISDSQALDRLSYPYGSNYRSCVLSAINAGIDMVMVPFRYELFIADLTYLVESGEIPIARIDDAVERILRVKFVAGLFEYPLTDRSFARYSWLQDDQTHPCTQCTMHIISNLISSGVLHRELAREAVRKSLVLLKNGKDPNKPFLPLNRNAERILVAGTHADNLGYQCGGWTATWMGASGRITIGTTILEAIKAAVGENTELVYEQRPSAGTFASQDFSFAIVVVGEGPYAETMGDDSELIIPFHGTELISSVADRVPTLVILISGRPLVLEPCLLEKIDALVAAWLPGSEGEGISDVIFGDHEFQGRLSCNMV